jgi:hypothetical protein
MAETTKIPEDWVKKCNENVDELWVPSAFLFETFSRSGVAKEKIFKIGEPLDVALYDPEVTTPFALPMPYHPQFRKPALEILEMVEKARSEEMQKERLPEENQEPQTSSSPSSEEKVGSIIYPSSRSN